MLMENELFLSELTKMFDSNRASGASLYLTMKRYDGRTKPKSKKDGEKKDCEYSCLIRAKYQSSRISTIVHSKDINKFQLQYANLLKGNMYGLAKKRDVKH